MHMASNNNNWVVLHFQPHTIDSLPSSRRIIDILKYHLTQKKEKILLVCPSGENDLSILDELIHESCLQKSTNQTATVSMRDRHNVSLTWELPQQYHQNYDGDENRNEMLSDESDESDDHFVDGFNVWKEHFSQWTIQLFSGQLEFDSILKEDEQVNQLVQRVMKLLLGTSLVGSVSSKIRAEVLTVGSEIISRILTIYLARTLNIRVGFIDSSLFLVSPDSDNYVTTIPSQIQYASINQHAFLEAVESIQSDLIIVNGNAARDTSGNLRLFSIDPKFGAECTVACIAKMINCDHVEFYVSGYGLCTCQMPGISQPIDGARLINELSFVEALEIAATSESRFISPLSLKVFQENDTPVHINSLHFEIGRTEGTIISSKFSSDENEDFTSSSQIKSICLRTGIIMISIDTFAMWQQVGFLSDVFALFKKYNLSVDYVTTSEANVTCSLDAITEDKSDEAMDRMDRINMLVKDLQSMNCRVSTIGPCASLSLVGRNIRGMLHKLGPIFEIFNSTSSNTNHPIHLISQAHSNVNLSFIVPQIENVDVLVTDVHEWIFKGDKEVKLNSSIGQDWRTLLTDYSAQAAAQRPAPVTTNAVSGQDVWWRQRAQELLDLIEQEQQPLYVYSGDVIKKRATHLKEMLIRDGKTGVINYIFFALKANPHPDILRVIESMNFGFECVSTQEVSLVLSLFPDLDRKRILFTPNFAPREDYEYGLNLDINLTLDNMFPLEAWPELFRNKHIFLRIDPGIGKGHHKKVKTAGVSSKFGIPIADFGKLAEICERNDITVVGLHAHVGSGILKDTKAWKDNAQFFLDLLMNNGSNLFKDVKIIDIGGGLGVPYRPEDQPLDISQVYHHMHSLMHGTKKYHDFIKQRGLQFWTEPGRYLSAESGILLARVTQTKKKSADISYVGLETGMNSLIRPTLYSAYHEIVNLSGLLQQNDSSTEFPSAAPSTIDDEQSSSFEHFVNKEKYTVVGPICETGDVLGEDRWMHKCENGHVVVICCAGSYGHSMSSFYNNRPPAKEIFLPVSQ